MYKRLYSHVSLPLNTKNRSDRIKKNRENSISMSKLSTIFTLVLLLSFGLIYASRPNLASFKGVSSLHEDVVAKEASSAGLDDESCEGMEGTEECLMRRTLAAHTDYIYTQKHKPKP